MPEDPIAARRLLVKGMLGPACGTLFLFAVLVALGIWQVQRLGWKNQILAAIDAGERQDAIPLTSSPREFEKVVVVGRWLEPVAHYGVEVRDTPYGSRMGSQIVVPLAREHARAVLVLLGWVMDGVSVALPPGEIHLTGYVRLPEHRGWLSPADNLRTARFFSLDPQEIGKALAVEVEPFTVVALQVDGQRERGPAHEPAAATRLPRPVNNHLIYAATWFGLAATLLAVFGVWVRKHLTDR